MALLLIIAGVILVCFKYMERIKCLAHLVIFALHHNPENEATTNHTTYIHQTLKHMLGIWDQQSV